MPDVLSLLQPMKDRLAAATPGPWVTGSEVAGTNGVYFGTAHDPDDPTEPGILLGEAHVRDATFIAAAPTDQAKLIAAVEAVEVMHRQDTHYGPYYCICGDKWPCSTVAALTQALGGDTA